MKDKNEEKGLEFDELPLEVQYKVIDTILQGLDEWEYVKEVIKNNNYTFTEKGEIIYNE